MRTITGTITVIQAQKDGYKAYLFTSEKEVYMAAIRISDLKVHTHYRRVEVG